MVQPLVTCIKNFFDFSYMHALQKKILIDVDVWRIGAEYICSLLIFTNNTINQ